MASTETVPDKAAKPKRQVHPNSLANLERTKFKPGVSGNPSGYGGNLPKISPIIRRYADMPYAEFAKINPKMLTMGELIAYKAYMDAIDDEGYQAGTKSRETIIDRVDGKVGGNQGDTNIQVNGGQVVVTQWPGGATE